MEYIVDVPVLHIVERIVDAPVLRVGKVIVLQEPFFRRRIIVVVQVIPQILFTERVSEQVSDVPEF